MMVMLCGEINIPPTATYEAENLHPRTLVGPEVEFSRNRTRGRSLSRARRGTLIPSLTIHDLHVRLSNGKGSGSHRCVIGSRVAGVQFRLEF